MSEPFLAVDPSHPGVLVAIAQTSSLAVWRSTDGGGTWTASRPPTGKDDTPSSGGGDAVVALAPDGVLLASGVAFDPEGRCTLLNRVGSYRSADGGTTFERLSSPGQPSRLPRHFFGEPPVASCPIPKGLTHVTTNDKPWLAADTSRSPHRGSVYLVWSQYDQTLSGRTFSTLLFARSRNSGRSYGPPVAIAPRTEQPEAIEQYSQVAVRPDGTVDLVWNEYRNGASWIVHRASRDGGASFGAKETVTRLRGTTPLGLVSSLAISSSGRLAVCWSASVAQKAYGRGVICAPHPPDCATRQRFVGDYIGAAAVPGTVWVDFVLPGTVPSSPNRVYVATIPTR